MRIGMGYDVHRLVAGRRLVLGGVTIPFEKGLEGHSDADVLVHAVCDALLGAAGLGDIGLHFPDSADEFKDIYSIRLLEETGRKIYKQKFGIVNIDATVFAQAPKLAPFMKAMKEKIAAALNIALDRVNIKATTTEGLGVVGSGDGMAAMCVALIQSLTE